MSKIKNIGSKGDESLKDKEKHLFSLDVLFKKELDFLNAYFHKRWDEMLENFIGILKKKKPSPQTYDEKKSFRKGPWLQQEEGSLKVKMAYKRDIKKLKILSRDCYKANHSSRSLIPSKPARYLSGISPPIQDLFRSMHYSLFPGGKRFRPLLILLVAEAFDFELEDVLPFALAVEMLHTYSLIHDDLPCMDNALERRGFFSNHKIFGEPTSLLSATSLLSEAFSLIASSYMEVPSLALYLIQRLSDAIGPIGMMGGQNMDMAMKAERGLDKLSGLKKEKYLGKIQELFIRKTGIFIQCSLSCAAVICGASEEVQDCIDEYSIYLGMAFQLADDIIDFQESHSSNLRLNGKVDREDREGKKNGSCGSPYREELSILNFIGKEDAKELLEALTEMCLSFTQGDNFKGLRKVAIYNRNRVRIEK